MNPDEDPESYCLTDEQVAEVRRRMAEVGAPNMTLEEVDAFVRRLLARDRPQ